MQGRTSSFATSILCRIELSSVRCLEDFKLRLLGASVSSVLYRDTGLLVLASLANRLISFLAIPLLTRFVSVAEFGTFDLVLVVGSLLVPLLTLCVGEAVFRFGISDSSAYNVPQMVSSAFAVNLIAAGLAAVGGCIAQVISGSLFGIYVVVIVIGELFFFYLQAVSRALESLPTFGVASFVFTILSAGLSVLFVIPLKLGLTGLILGYAIAYFLASIFGLFRLRFGRVFRWRSVSVACIFAMVRYSAPLVPNNIAWWFVNLSNRVLISATVGASANGVFAAGSKIPGVFDSIVGQFTLPWQTAASKIVSDSGDSKGEIGRVFSQSFVPVALLGASASCLSVGVFRILFDSRYWSGAPLVPLLLGASVLHWVALFLGGVQIALMRPKANGVSAVVGAGVVVLISIVLVPRVGIVAAAFASIVGNGCVAVLRLCSLETKFRPRLSRSVWISTLLLCVAIGISVLGVAGPLLISSIGVGLFLVGGAVLFASRRRGSSDS